MLRQIMEKFGLLNESTSDFPAPCSNCSHTAKAGGVRARTGPAGQRGQQVRIQKGQLKQYGWGRSPVSQGNLTELAGHMGLT